jgi:hypothetical protein
VITLSHFKIDVLLNENYFSKLIGERLGGEMINFIVKFAILNNSAPVCSKEIVLVYTASFKNAQLSSTLLSHHKF